MGPAIGVLVGFVLVRRVLVGGLPEGDDAPYHVAKNAFAFTQIFARGHLDGWGPTFSMGSQQFLLYGPGASLVAAALRLVSFGLVDQRTLVGWVGALAFVATAPAAYFMARGLRLGRTGASVVGLAALCVSVPYGTGLAGTFDLGLVPHQLAVPMVLVTLGALIRVVDQPDRRWVTLAAAAATGVTVTHLTSALVTLAAFGILVAARSLTPSDPSDVAAGGPHAGLRAAYRLGLAGLLAAGFGAWWLLPLSQNPGPRPATATWDTPELGQEVLSLVRTDLWGSQPIVLITLAALAICALWLLVASPAMAPLGRWRVSVVLAGPALLLALYAMYHLLPGDTGLLMVNRGTGYAALMWIVPIGVVADHAVARRSEPAALTLVALLGAGIVAFPSLIPASGLARPAPAPSPELQAASGVLARAVTPEGRFAWVHEPNFDTGFGPVHPELWLAMDADASTLNGFGGETISPVDTFLQYHLAEMDPREAEPQLVRNGVSHLIGRPATMARYESLPSWRRIWASDRLAVLEHVGPVNLAAPQQGQTTELTGWSPERVTWRTEGADQLVTGIPAFPKWHLSVDGSPVPNSERDGFLTARLPDRGAHTVEAVFRRSWADYVGIGITLVVIAWRAGGLTALRRRRVLKRTDQSVGDAPSGDDDG